MILVTGGTGLVGAHLLYFLTQQNDEILAIYRTKSKLDAVKKVFSLYSPNVEKHFSKIRWVQADLTDVPSLVTVFSSKKITTVYHCAALVSFNPKDYHKMRQINIEGTANLVNFSIDNAIKKFCFVSSIAAVGDAINGKPITEENEWNDQTLKSGYSITKFGAEMEVWRGSQEGLDVVIVNPGVILGGGFKDGSSKIFEQVKNGFKFYTEGVTGFVGVQDVVKVMIELMQSNIKNERYILVAENKSFKAIFFTIASEFGVKRPSIKIGKIATSIFWRLDWLLTKLTGKSPLLTKNSARSSHNTEIYSAVKIKKALNFNFESIDSVIKNVCRNY